MNDALPSFGRRFTRLYVLGLLGVAALPVVALPMLRATPLPTTRFSPEALALLSTITPALLLAAAVALGATLAHKLQLRSLLAHSTSIGVALQRLRPQLLPALALGAMTGGVIVMVDQLVFRLLLPEFFARAAAAMPSAGAGLLLGVLYGGLTEELLLRWGVMTVLAWALWRLFRRRYVLPGDKVMIAAIVIAALLFAAGHLPAAARIAPLETLSVVRVLLLNFIPGVVFGWLYWRWNLESAMLAHAGAHVAFFIARIAGLQ